MNFGAEGGTDAGLALGGGAGLEDGGGVPPRPRRGRGAGPGELHLMRARAVIAGDLPGAARGPGAVGENVTVSVSVWPGAIVVPSGRLVVAVNAPPNGGLDFSIVTGVPPVLVIVNVWVAVVPTETVPKSTAWLENSSSPGAAADPGQADRQLSPSVVSSVIAR